MPINTHPLLHRGYTCVFEDYMIKLRNKPLVDALAELEQMDSKTLSEYGQLFQKTTGEEYISCYGPGDDW
jgi:hypothetical protein